MRLRLKLKTLLLLVASVAGFMGLVMMDLRRDRALQSPDIVDIELLKGMGRRPISGGRLVQPDGMISFGYYGKVNVAGLQPEEARAKVIVHLRSYLSDETLGLVESYKRGSTTVTRKVPPEKSDRVSLAMVKKNSRNSNLKNCWACFAFKAGRFVRGLESIAFRYPAMPYAR